MPPKVKKTRKKLRQTQEVLLEKGQLENEKENNFHDSGSKGERSVRKVTKISFDEAKLQESRKSLSSLVKPIPKLKSLGFWNKKVKDLEENIKNKKQGLYEFSGTDESDSSYRRKKKPRKKTRLKKKVQPVTQKQYKQLNKINKIPLSGKKIKQFHMQSLCREQIVLKKERKKLADKGKQFTFSTGMSSLGITSTPAVSKDNLVGASNFLFLSPIINEENKYCNSVEGLPVKTVVDDKDPSITHLGQETPKVETKLKRISCRRVLRSGKVLNT